MELTAKLGLTRATFRTEAQLASALVDDDDDDDDDDDGGEGLSSDDDEIADGGVMVQPGDHFAMVPNLTAQLGATFSPKGWRVALTGAYTGSQFFVGDEDNDEAFGKLDSYFIVDGTVERELGEFSVFLIGRNLLNARHNTFGLISPNVRGPDTEPQPFLTPGLPLRVNAGVRYRF